MMLFFSRVLALDKNSFHDCIGVNVIFFSHIDFGLMKWEKEVGEQF